MIIDINDLKEKVKKTEGFIEKRIHFQNHSFSILSYRITPYSAFYEYNLFEARGLTIDNTTGNYYLSIHKFFNEGETEDTLQKWSELDTLEIKEKIDGSLIMPVIIDNEVYMKTKMSFDTYQAKKATEFINKYSVYKDFIIEMLNKKLIPLFEYISPFNQIVIDYDIEDLVLLHIRDLETGRYLRHWEILQLAYTDISLAKLELKKYKEIKHLAETEKGIEGWVVRNLDKSLYSQFRKIKTKWYFDMHKLISPDMFTDNKIIEHILNETIDDILSQLNENSEKRKRVFFIQNIISFYITDSINECLQLYKEEKDRKQFALKYKKHSLFGICMRCWDNKTEECLYNALKHDILKKTYRKEQAEKWVLTKSDKYDIIYT